MPLPSCSEISDTFSSTEPALPSKMKKRTAERRPTIRPALPRKKQKRTAKRLPKSPNMISWLRDILLAYFLSDSIPLDFCQITEIYNRNHHIQITKEQLIKVYEKLRTRTLQFSMLLDVNGFNRNNHSSKASCSNDIRQADCEIYCGSTTFRENGLRDYSLPQESFAKHVDVDKRDTVMQEPPVEQRFNAPNWTSSTRRTSTSCSEMSSVGNYQKGVSADSVTKFVESLTHLVRKCGLNPDYIDKLHEHFEKDRELYKAWHQLDEKIHLALVRNYTATHPLPPPSPPPPTQFDGPTNQS